MVAVVAVTNMPSTLEQTIVEEPIEAQITELRQALARSRGEAGRPKIRQVKLPENVYRVLVRIVDDLADGKAVSLTSAAQEMTTQEAASFLGVSRQFLVRLLDEGKIVFHRVGTHRRVYLQDLISFRKARDRRRHDAVKQMARAAVKDGVYDEF
jgi:excisionase family DNA binding protein